MGDDFMPMQRSSGIGWPSVMLLGLAAVVVTAFAVVLFRPDVAAELLDSVRGPAAAPAGVVANGATPVATPRATAASRGAPSPGAGVSAAGEPPVISVWSLPVAHAGQASQPVPVFHGPAAPPVALPPAPASRGRFVPSAAFAFTYNAAAPQPSPASNVADTQDVAPTPAEPPAQRPAPVAAKAVQAASEAPVAKVEPPPAPAPSPVAAPPPAPSPPPPPPKPKFAPGSLEDQIQKAVEAENAKKKAH